MCVKKTSTKQQGVKKVSRNENDVMFLREYREWILLSYRFSFIGFTSGQSFQYCT